MSPWRDWVWVVGLRREAQIAERLGRTVVGVATLGNVLGDAAGIVSFGLCGALDPDLNAGDLIIADAVTSRYGRMEADAKALNDLRAHLPDAHGGDMAGADAIIGTVASKASLRQYTGAAAVDMESHFAADLARQRGLPFAIVRAVSDGADRSLPRSAQAGFKADGEPDVGAVIRSLAVRPWELPALIKSATDAERAFKALATASRLLTKFPDKERVRSV